MTKKYETVCWRGSLSARRAFNLLRVILLILFCLVNSIARVHNAIPTNFLDAVTRQAKVWSCSSAAERESWKFDPCGREFDYAVWRSLHDFSALGASCQRKAKRVARRWGCRGLGGRRPRWCTSQMGPRRRDALPAERQESSPEYFTFNTPAESHLCPLCALEHFNLVICRRLFWLFSLRADARIQHVLWTLRLLGVLFGAEQIWFVLWCVFKTLEVMWRKNMMERQVLSQYGTSIF